MAIAHFSNFLIRAMEDCPYRISRSHRLHIACVSIYRTLCVYRMPQAYIAKRYCFAMRYICFANAI